LWEATSIPSDEECVAVEAVAVVVIGGAIGEWAAAAAASAAAQRRQVAAEGRTAPPFLPSCRWYTSRYLPARTPCVTGAVGRFGGELRSTVRRHNTPTSEKAELLSVMTWIEMRISIHVITNVGSFGVIADVDSVRMWHFDIDVITNVRLLVKFRTYRTVYRNRHNFSDTLPVKFNLPTFVLSTLLLDH
jgi:hypothetical protein